MVRFEEGPDAFVVECMRAGGDEEGLADIYSEETCKNRLTRPVKREGGNGIRTYTTVRYACFGRGLFGCWCIRVDVKGYSKGF